MMKKKKFIILISFLIFLVIVGALIIPRIIRYNQLKNGIYNAVEMDILGYVKYTPSLPENYGESNEYRDQLIDQIDYQFDMKNLKIIEKHNGNPENSEERFKHNYGLNLDVSEEIFYEIKLDVRVKYDFDEDNSVLTGEYSGWLENNIDYNHKWSEWQTEEHSVEAVKIDGKWYYKCCDDEE